MLIFLDRFYRQYSNIYYLILEQLHIVKTYQDTLYRHFLIIFELRYTLTQPAFIRLSEVDKFQALKYFQPISV